MEADVIDTSFDEIDPEVMVVQAEAACDFLKAISGCLEDHGGSIFKGGVNVVTNRER